MKRYLTLLFLFLAGFGSEGIGQENNPACLLLGQYGRFDPRSIVKPEINVEKIRISFQRVAGKNQEIGKLSYDGRLVGTWLYFYSGTIVSSGLNLGPASPFHRLGLGSLCYLVTAVRLFDQSQTLLMSENANGHARDLWKRFVSQGIAEPEPAMSGEYVFKRSALRNSHLDSIRQFMAEQSGIIVPANP